MKYVAFLRGINVGGKSLVKMSDLKMCFEQMGFTNVVTYINSGNVIFESDKSDKEKLVENLEKELESVFKMPLRVVVRSQKEIKKTLDSVPSSWKTREDIRCYVAFVKEPMTAKEVAQGIKINDNVDFIAVNAGVVYMTTLLTGVTKSGYNKFAGSKLYKEVTIRNYNTTKKVYEIMEGK